ncbi:MAG: hypothetical protein H5T69_16685 [Chloroflexi bacterium]|nr:hypothetical protein [Chloroflexota bacterium]
MTISRILSKRLLVVWAARFFPAVCLILLLTGCLLGSSKPSSELVYKLPTRITLDVGETLPGTDIRYVNMGEDGAHLLIHGRPALKRKGDSLDWSGQMREGVKVDLRLRIVWFNNAQLQLLGTATVTVSNPQPRRATISTSSPIEYGGPVVYGVDRGAKIPGTTLTYEAKTDEGAKLGNTDAYPYRKIGDSIFWEGVLRDGVYLRLDVRVLQYDERHLRLGGLATIWIGN